LFDKKGFEISQLIVQYFLVAVPQKENNNELLTDKTILKLFCSEMRAKLKAAFLRLYANRSPYPSKSLTLRNIFIGDSKSAKI
jgi:hypothetical protein